MKDKIIQKEYKFKYLGEPNHINLQTLLQLLY